MFATEFECQKLVDKCQIVVNPAYLEDLLAPQHRLRIPFMLGAHVVAIVPILAELPLIPTLLNMPKQFEP